MNSVITRLEIEEDIIQVKLMNVEKNPLFVADVFETISREGVNIDMISSVMLEDEMRIDFTCDAKAQSALNKAIEEVKKNHPRIGVFASKNVGKLVVEGHMENEVGFASKLFKVLGDNQIPFAQVTTSEVSISYVIEKKYLKKALEKNSGGISIKWNQFLKVQVLHWYYQCLKMEVLITKVIRDRYRE